MTRAITKLTLDYAKKSRNELPFRDDYLTLPVDLNDKTPHHTSCVFLSFTRAETSGEPITGIDIRYTQDSHPPTVVGWDLVSDKELNHGARGEFVWLYQQTERGTPPITDIVVRSTQRSERSAPEGYAWLPKDTNKGARGRFVFLYYSTGPLAGPPLTSIPVELVKDSIAGRAPRTEVSRAQVDADKILIYRQELDLESYRLPRRASVSDGLLRRIGSEENQTRDFAVELDLKSDPGPFSIGLNCKLGLKDEFKAYRYDESNFAVQFPPVEEACTLYFAQVKDILEVRQFSTNRPLTTLISYPEIKGYFFETGGKFTVAAVEAAIPMLAR